MSDESYAELQEAVAARSAQLRAHQEKRVAKVAKANAKSLAKEVEDASELDDKDRSGLTQAPGEAVSTEAQDIEPVGEEVIVGSAANQEQVTAITNSAVKEEKVEERKLETPEKDDDDEPKKTAAAKKAAAAKAAKAKEDAAEDA